MHSYITYRIAQYWRNPFSSTTTEIHGLKSFCSTQVKTCEKQAVRCCASPVANQMDLSVRPHQFLQSLSTIFLSSTKLSANILHCSFAFCHLPWSRISPWLVSHANLWSTVCLFLSQGCLQFLCWVACGKKCFQIRSVSLISALFMKLF